MLLRLIIGALCVLLYLPLSIITFPALVTALGFGIDAWSLLVLIVYMAWIGGLLFGCWMLWLAFSLFLKSMRAA